MPDAPVAETVAKETVVPVIVDETPAAVTPAAPVAAPPPPADPELEARRQQRREATKGLSELAKATALRFSESKAAKDARVHAERVGQESERKAQEAVRKATEVTSELEQLRQELALAKKDTWAWAKAQGLTPQQVAERELAENTEDAELAKRFRSLEEKQAAAQAKADAAEAKAVAAEERLNAIIKDAEERANRAARIEQWENLKQAAWQSFEKAKDKYEHVARVVTNADALARKIVATNDELKMHENPKIAEAARAGQYTDDEIIEYLEHEYSRGSAAQVKAPPVTTVTTQTGGGAPNGSVATQAAGNGSAPTKTLTNADASPATTVKRPDDFDLWSNRKQDAWLAKHMKDGTLTSIE